MRTIRVAFVGFMVFFFLSSVPAMAAKAVAVPYPGRAVQTHQLTRAAYLYAITADGGNPNEQVPAFMGEGVIAALIVIFGVYAADARKKRLDDRRLLYSEFQAALRNFREQSLTIQFNQNKGHVIQDDVWDDLNAAKARVDASADAVLDRTTRPAAIMPAGTRARDREETEARLAKDQTSAMLKTLENPPSPKGLPSG